MPSSPTTLIRLEGRDALDLLHRISTQHLRELEPGHCSSTLFCDFRGRVAHRVAVAQASDGSVWLVRVDAPADELMAQVDRQIFRDDVRMEDVSARATVIAIAAPTGAAAGTISERDGVPTVLHLDRGIDLLVGPVPSVPGLGEAARIRKGAPLHGHEIRDAFNPFEIGLASDVHLDKGCFTGQEALLRMMTYGGVRRRLVMIEGEGRAPASGETVRQETKDAGVVTSSAPEDSAWVALGVLRHDALASDAPFATESGAAIALVTPFTETRPLGLPDPSPRV